MTSKIRIADIIQAEFGTFSGYRFRTKLADSVLFIIAPLILGVAAYLWAPPVYAVGSVLSGVTVFTALLVALLVNVFNFSVKIRRDEKIRPEEPLSITVNELMANAAWAVLVGLVLVILLVAAAATQVPSCAINTLWVGVLVLVFLHLMACVLMVISRIWTAHEQIKDLPPKR